MRSVFCTVIVVCHLIGFPSWCKAQDAGVARDLEAAAGANAQEAAEFAAAEAQRYRIQIDGDRQPLELVEQPVLRWSNPTAGEVYGSVYLWTRNGCPEATASIYRYFDRDQINVELVSLSAASLKGHRSGKERWTAEAGVTFQPLNGPAAADTPERRALQMRSLAREFSAELANRDDDEKFTALRLMARPLFGWRASDKSGREGAIFAFVTTNDPEILLLLESRIVDGERQWHFAAARTNFQRLRLSHDGKTVWDVPRLAPPWQPLRGPQGTYLILQWDSLAEAESDKSADANKSR